MANPGVPPSALREQLETIGVDLNPGEMTGYATLDAVLNLNAVAIGLGLENIEYEPERFQGLIYHLEQPEVTVVLFSTGLFVPIDARTEQAVEQAVKETVDRIVDIGLVELESRPSVETAVESIPLPEDVDIDVA